MGEEAPPESPLPLEKNYVLSASLGFELPGILWGSIWGCLEGRNPITNGLLGPRTLQIQPQIHQNPKKSFPKLP